MREEKAGLKRQGRGGGGGVRTGLKGGVRGNILLGGGGGEGCNWTCGGGVGLNLDGGVMERHGSNLRENSVTQQNKNYSIFKMPLPPSHVQAEYPPPDLT